MQYHQFNFDTHTLELETFDEGAWAGLGRKMKYKIKTNLRQMISLLVRI